MSIAEFVGRTNELIRLDRAYQAKTARLVVIKGRRRIGKSRLIAEFIRDKKAYRFLGLAPNKETTAQSQRNHFAKQLKQQTGLPDLVSDDWIELFGLLNERTKSGKIVIVLDEITWMGSKDSEFLSKLHYAWEEFFKHNPGLTLILCGSVSAWIEKNILSSTGYFGRVSLKLSLDELPISRCNQLLQRLGFRGSSFEKLQLLCITGGVPWYLENIESGLSANENIKNLCFIKDGLLVDEFDNIFADLFSEKRREIQKNIVAQLVNGPLEYDEIAKTGAYQSSGQLSEYLDELILSGFVTRDYIWSFKTTSQSKRISKYRLKDNYIRFYLKYVQPKLTQINNGKYIETDIALLPGWETTMGLQFENLIINNRNLLCKKLQLDPMSISQDGPYFQRKTSKQQGCQIDFLIQSKYKTLYVCEIKFSKNTIGRNVIDSVKEKINRLKVPRGYACIPVLILAGDASSNVLDEEYFVHIINVCDWVENDS